MPVRIRLARHGRKSRPYYYIVAADSRAPRDGKFIERIGAYNPMTNPATIDLDFDKALSWIQKGAQPSDTARAILKDQGVMFKNHLLKGVTKGAFTEEQAEEKFQAWLKENEDRAANAVKKLDDVANADKKARMDAEVKVREAMAADLAKKKAELAGIVEEEATESTADDAETPEDTVEEATAEAAPAEEAKAEAAPADEPVKDEAPAEEPASEETAASTEEKKEE